MNSPDSNIDDKIRQLHERVKYLIAQNSDEATIISDLGKEGIDQGYAELIIENVRIDIHNRKEFWKHIVLGSLIIVAGILVNFLSYWNAVENVSPSFLVIIGVIVFGVIVIARGVIIFRK